MKDSETNYLNLSFIALLEPSIQIIFLLCYFLLVFLINTLLCLAKDTDTAKIKFKKKIIKLSQNYGTRNGNSRIVGPNYYKQSRWAHSNFYVLYPFTWVKIGVVESYAPMNWILCCPTEVILYAKHNNDTEKTTTDKK